VEKLDELRLPWIPRDGVSVREDPYPHWNFPFSFRWFCGPVSQIEFVAERAGRYLVGVEYQNPSADLPVISRIDGATVSTAILSPTPSSTSRTMHFLAAIEPGRHAMTFEFGHWREPHETDNRRLALAVRDISIIFLDDGEAGPTLKT
jgi:hypothetical protein